MCCTHKRGNLSSDMHKNWFAFVQYKKPNHKMSTVWIVTIGEEHEGYEIQEVFKTHALAKKYAIEYMKKYNWPRVEQNTIDEQLMIFRNKCEYIEVSEWDVKGT